MSSQAPEVSYAGTVSAVSALSEIRDPYTASHERAVADLAGAIAAELGLSHQVILAH
ncbi:MAG: hypothetical protein HY042_08000 [Spirochaetia bacterium]|nr:hypothetical protein [Spirochaetia bacterium]